MSKILGELAALHEATAAYEQLEHELRSQWRTDDVRDLSRVVAEIKADRRTGHRSVKTLIRHLVESEDPASATERLCDVHETLTMLDETLHFLLADYARLDLPALTDVFGQLRAQTGTLAELLPVLRDLAELPAEFNHALRTAPLPLDDFERAIGHKSVNSVYRIDRSISRFEGRTLNDKLERLQRNHREWLSLNAQCIRGSVRRKFIDHINVSSQPASQLDSAQKAFKKTYSAGRRDLEHEFGKTMRYKSIRELAADHSGTVIQDLKPIWLMSPLSVSDTLPLDPDLFDVVIFDEASQIPLEEAIPAIYRSHQAIVVGDEMQLPPTSFFASTRIDEDSVVVEEDGEPFEVDLDSDSFLNQSASNLPSTLLAWHYRSRYESLISLSNAAFYNGNLNTVPDRQRVLADRPELRVKSAEDAATNVDQPLSRSISFHQMDTGVYEDRRNPSGGVLHRTSRSRSPRTSDRFEHWYCGFLGSSAGRDRRRAKTPVRRRSGILRQARS